jgi:hypothetical protein
MPPGGFTMVHLVCNGTSPLTIGGPTAAQSKESSFDRLRLTGALVSLFTFSPLVWQS